MGLKQVAAVAMLTASVGAIAAPSFWFKNLDKFALAGQQFDGSFELKFENFESFTAGLDTFVDAASTPIENFGTLRVTSITDGQGLGIELWNSGDSDSELTGVFYDIMVSSVSPSGSGFRINSTGGKFDLYLNDEFSLLSSGGFAQGLGGYCAADFSCYNGITNVAGGVKFLSAEWVPGVDVTDPAATITGTFDVLTSPQTGSAQGFLAVVAGSGAYAANFNTNGFLGGAADLFSQNDFCTPGQPGCVSLAAAGGAPEDGGWALRSNDPVRGFFVPEPGSLALAGLALIGAGLSRRRKQAQ